MNRPDNRYLSASYHDAQTMAAEDAAGRARRHAQSAEDGYRKLRGLIQGPLAGLFGDWVRGTFERPLENVQEHAGEAFYSYAQALTERDERIRSLADDVTDIVWALTSCAERLQDRYAKAHKPLPDELLQVVVIAAAKAGDWLFPPADERHVHVTGSGGQCRNPACSYNSDNEPF